MSGTPAATIAGLCLALALTSAALARPLFGARFDASYSSATPRSPTGLHLLLAGEGSGRPAKAPVELSIGLPRGSRLDTRALRACRASRRTFRRRGRRACPPESRIGGGRVEARAGARGIDPVTYELDAFNAHGAMILHLTPRPGAPGPAAVVRARLGASTVVVRLPRFHGPDGPVVLTSLELRIEGRVGPAGRTYARTPATCPRSGRWTWRAAIVYGDGSRRRLRSGSPCR